MVSHIVPNSHDVPVLQDSPSRPEPCADTLKGVIAQNKEMHSMVPMMSFIFFFKISIETNGPHVQETCQRSQMKK